MNASRFSLGVILCCFVLLLTGARGEANNQRALFPREIQQQAVGAISRDKEYGQATRDAAFQLLCELAKSDGEYFVATDELTKLVEQDPQFFFQEMRSRKRSFEQWNSSLESSCFVIPYLYTNKSEMEKRRLRLINELTKFRPALDVDGSINSMRKTTLNTLLTIKIRVVE